jgi:hypothetical protein
MARKRIPGLTPESERAVNALLQELDERILRLETKPGRPGVLTTNTVAREGEFLTFEAPATGLQCVLPTPTAANRNARVTLSFKNANPVRLTCLKGTINRANFVINSAPGTIECICDGDTGWSVDTGLSSSGSATDAAYLVSVAHGSLPNARVATDSTEIDADTTVPSVISWALRTASVTLAKLQDLTGLSVLGRAANSTGVMAAITASTIRHVVRLNNDGDQLEWGYPVRVTVGGEADLGDFYLLNFVQGTNADWTLTDEGSGQLTVAVTVDDFPLSGLANQAADTVVANVTGSPAPPTAHSLSTLFGGGLSYAAGVAAVGTTAASRMTINANSITWSGFDLAHNGGTVAPGWVGIDIIDTATTTWVTSAPGAGLIGLEVDVDLTANFAWTGVHNFTGTDFTVDVSNLATISGNSVLIDAGVIDVEGAEINLVTGTTGDINLDTLSNINLTAEDAIDIISTGDTTDNINLTANAGRVDLTATQIRLNSSGGAGGFLTFQEASASTPAVPAASGMFWVRNDTPSMPMFTDDTNVDHVLIHVSGISTANSALTFSTSNITVTSVAVAANDWKVSSLYRMTGWWKYTHAAGATPRLIAELLVGASVIESVELEPFPSFTGSGQVQAVICCRTTGAGGTIKSEVMFISNMGPSTDWTNIGTTTTATDAINTTIANTITLRMRMVTAIAANTLTLVQGYTERLN